MRPLERRAQNGKDAEGSFISNKSLLSPTETARTTQRRGSRKGSWTLQPAATVSRLISAHRVSIPRCDCQRELQQFFFFCCSAIISTTSTNKRLSREYFDTLSQLPNARPTQSTNQCLRGSRDGSNTDLFVWLKPRGHNSRLY